MKMRQHDVARPANCHAGRASAAICGVSRLSFGYGKRRIAALALGCCGELVF
jgi:hypothetical protein